MRYIRQERFSKLGKDRQALLENARVSIVGMGALGTTAAEMLVRSGVKNLILIDRDFIELSNLQRQALYKEEDVGKLKALAAKDRLMEINSEAKIESHVIDLDCEDIDLIRSDLILDCTDNFGTRFLINEYAIKNNIPWIYSSAIGSRGMTFNVMPGKACFRCLFKEPTENLGTCETDGIINTIVHVISGLQVTEALKIITKQEARESLLHYDIWENKILEIKVNKDNNCSSCNKKFEYLNGSKSKDVIKICGSNSFQIKGKAMDLKQLINKFNGLGEIRLTDHCLFFNDMAIFDTGRVLIKAKSKEEAKSIFDRYLG